MFNSGSLQFGLVPKPKLEPIFFCLKNQSQN